ncbi:MAG: hypothetical protein JRI68_05405 [Deltaproteobacteria bacterium]|nr:hypothetical protein [Deltaproteobacteria bacterium]
MRLTQSRGRLDTPALGSVGDMWGLARWPLRPLMVALFVATLLHGPLLPTGLSGWFGYWLREPAQIEDTGPQQEVVVPIELDMGLVDDEVVGKPAEPEPETPDEMEVVDVDDIDSLADELMDDDEPDAGAPDPLDGGAPDAATQTDLDAGLLDGGQPVDGGPADAGPAEIASVDDPDADVERGKKVADPYSEAGGAAGIGAEHPNVRIYFAADVLRQRPKLAETFGELLGAIPQWQQLLGGTGLNPIVDFDHILISGPQMRNPRWIVVALDYNVPHPKMRQAIDLVVRKSGKKGRWERRPGLEIAVIGKNAERRAVLSQKKRMMVVLPAEAADQIDNIQSPKFKFKKSTGAGIVIHVITPWRAFVGSKVRMPKSIKWMRVRFRFKGADFEVEAEGQDESEEAAREHLKLLRAEVDSLPKLGPLRAFGEPTWEQKGDRIIARADVSSFQLRLILVGAKSYVDDIAKRAAKRKKRKNKGKGKVKAKKKGRRLRLKTKGAKGSSAPPTSQPKGRPSAGPN